MGEKERIIELIKKIVRGEGGGGGGGGAGDSKDAYTEEHVLQEAMLISDRINIVVKKEEDALTIIKELRDMLVIPTMTVPQQLRAVKLFEVLVSNCRVLRLAMSKDRMWAEFLYTLVTVRFNKPESEAVQTAIVTAISHWSDFGFSAVGNEDKLFDQFLVLYGDLVKFGMSIVTLNNNTSTNNNKKDGETKDGKEKEKENEEEEKKEENVCDWANYSGDESDIDSDSEDYYEHPKTPAGSDKGENTIEIRQTENSKTVMFTPRKTKIKLSSNLALANGVRQSSAKSTEEVGWFRSLFGRRSSATPEEIKENGLVYVNELLNYVKILREGRLLLESQIIRANELTSLLNELLKPLTELLNADFVTKNDKLVMDLLDINETAIKAMKEYKIYFDNTYEIINTEQKSTAQAPANAPAKDTTREKKNELITNEETGLRLNKFPAKPSLVATIVTPNYDPKVIFTDDPKEPLSSGGRSGEESGGAKRIVPTPYTLKDSYKDTFGIDLK